MADQGLWSYALSHLSGLGIAGYHTFVWSDAGALDALVMVGGAVVLAVVASVLWHLRGARPAVELGRPASWVRLPAVFAAGGLVVTLLSAVSLGGTLFGSGGSVTVAPSPWTFLLLGLWGAAIDALSRTVAPRLAPVLPERLAARARATRDVASPAAPAPQPMTPEQARRARRWAMIGGAAVVVVVGGIAAVSVANSVLFTPEKAARQYLDAVADGDVDAALELESSSSRARTVLMTTDVYAAAADRPTSYSLGAIHTGGDIAVVEVHADDGVGGDGDLTLEKGSKKLGLFDQWEVTGGLSSSLSLPESSSGAVTVNGVEVDTERGVQLGVLPGTYTVDAFAGGEWFEAQPDTLEIPLGEHARAEQPRPGPSAALEEEVDRAMAEWLDGCMASTALEPEDCPQSAYASGDVRNLSWELTTPPTIDWSYLDPSFPMTLSVIDGVATATYEVDESYGFGPERWVEQTEESALYFNVTIDESGDELSIGFSG